MQGRKKTVIGTMAGVLFLTGCREALDLSVGSVGTDVAGRPEQGAAHSDTLLTENDCRTQAQDAVLIDLGDPKADETESYLYEGGKLTVRRAGDYRLTGRMEEGGLVIDVYDDDIVHLILDGVEIDSDSGAAVYVEKARKVILTLESGTENIMSDSSDGDAGHRACVFSNADLTINGDGTLYVYGNHADGIRSKDRLKVVRSSLYVQGAVDGIRGNDAVILTDSSVEVECGGTAIRSDSEKDMVVIRGGGCKVTAGDHAIVSNHYVSIRDCAAEWNSAMEAVLCGGIIDVE